MKTIAWIAAGCALLCLTACGPDEEEKAPVATYDVGMPLKTVMSRIVDPAAQKFWHSAGGEDTAEGTQSLAPTTDEGWLAAEAAAATIAESGNLILVPGRARDQAVWAKYAHQMNEVGLAALAAVKAKNEAQMFETGGRLYEVCQGCHVKYYLPYIDSNGDPIKGGPLDPNAPPAPK